MIVVTMMNIIAKALDLGLIRTRNRDLRALDHSTDSLDQPHHPIVQSDRITRIVHSTTPSMADHPYPPQTGPQTGVKGIKADSQKRAETDLDLHKLTIEERNRYLESKSFQAQTHDEEYQVRAMQQAERLDGKVVDRDGSAKGKDVGVDQHEGEGDEEEDDQAFKRQWRERRLREMKQQHKNHGLNDSAEAKDRKDETNHDWKLEKHRLREVGPEGFLKAVEGSGWTAVLLYEPVSSLHTLFLSLVALQVI